MKDLDRLRQQVQAAWAKVPADTKAKLALKMAAAHFHTLAARKHALSAAPRPHRELAMLESLLHGDPDHLLGSTAAAVPQGLFTTVDADGAVYFGNVDYDATDPGWAYCLPAMVETENATPPFKVGNVIQIPDNTTMAILGDWGGWNGPAQSIAAAAKASSYLVHIGDVYYAGTNGGALLDPYEPTHFVNVWPGVAGRSFALNSNHDMYAHATGYALTTLKAPAFLAQGGNCFALSNQAFRFVGLDSAYDAPDNTLEDFPGYMKGYLGDLQGLQMTFLKDQIGKLTAGQNLVLLTHHNGLNLDGSIPQPSDDPYQLWQQVTQVLQQQLPAAASRNVLWYWGHEHAGAVYKPQQVGAVTIYPRCCGHGCIPWGFATVLAASANVLWFEKKILGPGSNYFVTNGYATLTLNGASLTEAFFDQNGNRSWSGTFP